MRAGEIGNGTGKKRRSISMEGYEEGKNGSLVMFKVLAIRLSRFRGRRS